MHSSELKGPVKSIVFCLTRNFWPAGATKVILLAVDQVVSSDEEVAEVNSFKNAALIGAEKDPAAMPASMDCFKP